MGSKQQIAPLPNLMVAPNGARRTKKDHPKLPISIDEIVADAVACERAGADGIHIHVRNPKGEHILDAALYKQVLSELETAAPTLALQITTEAVGQYRPANQRALVRAVKPKMVSVSIAEMFSEGETSDAFDFYSMCQDEAIAVQHILYDLDDLKRLEKLLDNPKFENSIPQLLFVLGRYSINQESSPDDLIPFLSWLETSGLKADWAVCAFGIGETDCLVAAHKVGGKIRIGFENSLWNKDGTLANDNAERVVTILGLTTG